MWPAKFWETVYEPLIRRAAGLGRASGAGRSRPLREGLGALRRAGRRRRPGRAGGGACRRPRRRARHPVRGRLSRSAAGCLSDGGEIDGMPAADWVARSAGRARGAARRPHHDAHHACSASMTAAPMARSSGSTTTCRCRPSISRASGSGASSPSAAWSRPARSSGRSCFGGNDRPGVMLARRCAPTSTAIAAAPGEADRAVHQQ